MRHRNLGLGVLLAAAVAAAWYLAAGRHGAGSPGQPDAGDTAAPADLSAQDLRLHADDVAVQVAAGSRPILAFEENQVLFRFEGAGAQAGQPVAVAEAEVSFTMKMDMGKHRYTLVPGTRDGWLQAEYVLPACPSGNRRWYGDVTFSVAGRPYRARYRFDLEPPAKGP